MKLIISTSNRIGNSYKIGNDIKEEKDTFISLNNCNLKYCMGCRSCINGYVKYCIIRDDMDKIYENLDKYNDIVFICPIYMDFINGITKNLIDRLYSYYGNKNLKGKNVYLITIGDESEEEQEPVVETIKAYFNDMSTFFDFNFKFIRNFTSNIDHDVVKSYNNYNEIIESIRNNFDK
ncbi:MAG TPA: flavodoxin family protein [Bacilli bacterium]|nr:flavodoxin family protein [Bacilli bacterium]